MIELFLAGVTLGLYAGFSPGPLLALVISQSIKHGYREGFKVAFTPLISDVPIILISLLFLTLVAGYNSILGVISIVGGFYLIYLAYGSFKTRGIDIDANQKMPKSLRKGITLNLLNPAPYIFWITIGGPIIIPAYNENPLSLVLFITGFYTLLVGSKIILAYFTGKSRDFLTGKTYSHVMRILGFILTVFGVYYIYQGIQLLQTMQ